MLFLHNGRDIFFIVSIFTFYLDEMATTEQSTSSASGGIDIPFVGRTIDRINGNKLPSNREVLQLYFHHVNFIRKDTNESAKFAIRRAQEYWKSVDIPTQQYYRCKLKFKKLYEELRNMRKCYPRGNDIDRKRASEFESVLDDLFDIAVQNAELLITENKRTFLQNQRMKERVGVFNDVENSVAPVEEECQTTNKRGRKRAFEIEPPVGGIFWNSLETPQCVVLIFFHFVLKNSMTLQSPMLPVVRPNFQIMTTNTFRDQLRRKKRGRQYRISLIHKFVCHWMP